MTGPLILLSALFFFLIEVTLVYNITYISGVHRYISTSV